MLNFNAQSDNRNIYISWCPIGLPSVCRWFSLVFVSLWIFIILHWCVLDLLQIDVIFKTSRFVADCWVPTMRGPFFYWAIMLVALLCLPFGSILFPFCCRVPCCLTLENISARHANISAILAHAVALIRAALEHFEWELIVRCALAGFLSGWEAMRPAWWPNRKTTAHRRNPTVRSKNMMP